MAVMVTVVERTPKEISKVVNIEVYRTDHQRLRLLGIKDAKFRDIIHQLLDDMEKMKFDIVSIDEKDPKGYRVVFTLGNATYLLSNGQSKLLEKP